MNDAKPEAEYFRTRNDCMSRLKELTIASNNSALLAFDFPFGYPAGSDLKGGRIAGKTLSDLLKLEEDDGNNRFEVASILNRSFQEADGPFWGCPKNNRSETLTPTRPTFVHSSFKEWRHSEAYLKQQGYRIMNVWQLLGQGSVGSQTLIGLAELYRFSQIEDFKKDIRFWPFETNWQKELKGIVFAEIWPSLNSNDHISHPIKDARQVTATRDWLLKHAHAGTLRDIFEPPDFLKPDQLRQVHSEEGWIVGINDLKVFE